MMIVVVFKCSKSSLLHSHQDRLAVSPKRKHASSREATVLVAAVLAAKHETKQKMTEGKNYQRKQAREAL